MAIPIIGPEDARLPAPRLMLASASPRRAQLLRQIGVAFEVQPAQLIERRGVAETIESCVSRLAQDKAREVYARLRGAGDSRTDALVLGADTAVAIDDRMLGKPCDESEALTMLAQLSGRTHEVVSAVALIDARGMHCLLSRSRVRLRAITVPEARRYWASGEPADKAGAYAIQGFGAIFVQDLQGSYSGVMGLPLFETAQLLDAAGMPRWRD